MNTVTKATATVSPVRDDSEHGAFDVILSTADLDRDGDMLHASEWKTPLPETITFDSDHGMSVATTVGSGRPFINKSGQLQVRGTFASTPHAQEVRALVNEGHIRTVSVAFSTENSKKTGKPSRELLNGAFVAVPANPNAVVLSSKAAKPAVADPGYRDDKLPRYPLHSPNHVLMSALDFADEKNAYPKKKAKKIKKRIRAAADDFDMTKSAKTTAKKAKTQTGALDDADKDRVEPTLNDRLQRIHDAAVDLGANCPYPGDPPFAPGNPLSDKPQDDTKKPAKPKKSKSTRAKRLSKNAAALRAQIIATRLAAL